MTDTPKLEDISPRLQRIAALSKEAPHRALTTLSHHIDLDFLKRAYSLTRKDGAVGIDGQSSADYEVNLQGNLQSLLNRFKTGTYRAPPVRRAHLPKPDGRTREIGIPTFEDKILQRAVTMVLEAVYEQEFLDCSFGFRPGRSAHQAIDRIWSGLMDMGGGFVLDADIKTFFDDLDHKELNGFLDRRIRDGVLRRTVNKWLKAGVMEKGQVHYPKEGTPQGGVVSPLLANVYLHEVLDRWFEEMVKPVMRGPCFLVRYADDFVMCFQREDDARRVLAVLGKRLARFALTLHPDKTHLINFARPDRWSREHQVGDPGTFNFLGFTHYWGKSRKGRWTVMRKTEASRFARGLRSINLWLKQHRHAPVDIQHIALRRKLIGHDAYYGITGNHRRLKRFHHWVTRLWHKWLSRRSQKGQITWHHFNLMLQRYLLPPARVIHSVYRH